MTKATNTEKHRLALCAQFHQRGYDVMISRDGHITFCVSHAGRHEPWRDGRYISEYRIVDGMYELV